MANNQNEGFDPTDPVGTWRTIRDANLDAWAKGMATLVNTEAFSKALGSQLDTMLAASAPIQKMVSQYMENYLAQANMPSRAEVISLAQRMTNIEMRLDDMDARLDEILQALRVISARESAPADADIPPATLIAEAAAAPAAEAEAAPKPKPAARSRRKPAAE